MALRVRELVGEVVVQRAPIAATPGAIGFGVGRQFPAVQRQVVVLPSQDALTDATIEPVPDEPSAPEAELDVGTLADRVYRLMRADLAIARERE